MKSILPALLFFTFLQLSFTGQAQVSKLANNINPEFAIPLGDFAVVVTASDSLWRTNGTPAGTFKYTNEVAMDSTLGYAVLNNKIYFCGITAASGAELWVTDGTAAGTKLVKDIKNGSGNGRPRYFEVLNNTIFFFADNGTDGTELWKSNGSADGTVIVKNINPTGSSVPSFSIPLPPPLPSISQEFASQYFTKNNFLYFTATDGTNGVELWKTDGTAGNTSMVKNINTAPGASSFPWSFYAYGSEFLFTAYTNTTGNELWKTDGTEEGTVLIKDIDPNNTNFPAYAPTIYGFTTFKNKVYFDARDSSHGYEGWVTDGTEENTKLLKDINPGKKDGIPQFADALFINDKMIFPATSAANGTELWVSDGSDNTSLFKDINAGTKSSDPLIYLNGFGSTDINQYHTGLFNGFVFLKARTPDGGSELWKTNGTADGTVRVKDINPGADSSLGDLDGFFSFYTANKFYVAATDGSTGYELWQSDGTGPNTTQVKDIFATPDSSSFPQPVGALNGIILFSANDGDNKPGNRDLFRFDGTFESPLPLKLSQFGGDVVGTSVRLKWSTAQEINTSHFEIQRSTDGRNFQTIGKVTAAKNSSVKKDYTYDDANALASGGKLFYQLKMVDGDGKATYSKILPFSKESNGKLLTYPNPVRDELTVTANTGNRKQLSLLIFDASGKQVYSQKLASLMGSNTYPVPVASFAKGTYYVKVVTDGGVETSRFVKD